MDDLTREAFETILGGAATRSLKPTPTEKSAFAGLWVRWTRAGIAGRASRD